jgi:hypothetical protein
MENGEKLLPNLVNSVFFEIEHASPSINLLQLRYVLARGIRYCSTRQGWVTAPIARAWTNKPFFWIVLARVHHAVYPQRTDDKITTNTKQLSRSGATTVEP